MHNSYREKAKVLTYFYDFEKFAIILFFYLSRRWRDILILFKLAMINYSSFRLFKIICNLIFWNHFLHLTFN